MNKCTWNRQKSVNTHRKGMNHLKNQQIPTKKKKHKSVNAHEKEVNQLMNQLMPMKES